MPLLSSCGSIQYFIAQQLNEVSATESPIYLNYINATTHDIERQLLNRSPRYLESSANHTVSAGTYQYPFPMTDFASMYSVVDPVNTRKLSYVTMQEWNALSPSAIQNDIPTHYTVFNENIYFYPVPNSNYTYQYFYQKYLGDVSAESAAMPFPNRYLDAYVTRGIQYGLERRGDFTTAKIFEARYKEQVDFIIQALKDVGLKRIKSPREFKPNFTSDPIKNTIWNA